MFKQAVVMGKRRNWQVLGLENCTEATNPLLAAHSVRGIKMAAGLPALAYSAALQESPAL